MQDELKPGIGRQVDTVSLVLRSGERWEEAKLTTADRHARGELGQDLWQAIAIPHRMGPIHGRNDQNRTARQRLREAGEEVAELDDDWLHPLAGAGVLIGIDEEVGDAGDQDDVAIGGDPVQALIKNGEAGARDELRRGQRGTGTTIDVVDVAPDVGVTDQHITELTSHRGDQHQLLSFTNFSCKISLFSFIVMLCVFFLLSQESMLG